MKSILQDLSHERESGFCTTRFDAGSIPGIDRIEEALCNSLMSSTGTIRDMCFHILGSGGKRIRPMLVFYSGLIFSEPTDELLHAAVAAELIHMASLVHDDIIDRSSLRRGRPSINKVWGTHFAVLCGDYLFAKAFGILAEKKLIRCMDYMVEAIENMCHGEILQADSRFARSTDTEDCRIREAESKRDSNPEPHREQNLESHRESKAEPYPGPYKDETLKEHRNINLKECKNGSMVRYLECIAKKTAIFLSCCCKAGACIAGADDLQLEIMGEYGLHLGYAFQIIDDILDISGDADEMGKPKGEDLRQGNITAPLIFLLNDRKYSEAAARIIRRGGSTDVELGSICDMAKESGAVEQSMKMAAFHIEKARKCIEMLPYSPYNSFFHELAGMLLSRMN